MPALRPTRFGGEIVWLGRVPDRSASMRSEPCGALNLTFDGIAGEAHSGTLRPSCSRVTAQHPLRTTIRNVRQVIVLAEEDLREIANGIGPAPRS